MVDVTSLDISLGLLCLRIKGVDYNMISIHISIYHSTVYVVNQTANILSAETFHAVKSGKLISLYNTVMDNCPVVITVCQ